jgi:hypothetical protein
MSQGRVAVREAPRERAHYKIDSRADVRTLIVNDAVAGANLCNAPCGSSRFPADGGVVHVSEIAYALNTQIASRHP